MRIMVTGAAGFIGSHVVERSAALGHEVVAVDAFTDYYDVAEKRANQAAMVDSGAVAFAVADLSTESLDGLLADVDVVAHLAGQPGVRDSWTTFDTYTRHNVTATQRLLDASVRAGVPRFVYASSSSIYGERHGLETGEDDVPQPFSPYGVTKLAGEHLCGAYARNHELDVVALRYFTVYGPRQRPDMAIRRLVEAARSGSTFPLFGDGSQTRDMTYVADVVDATLQAATADTSGFAVANIAGGTTISLRDLIALVGETAGNEVPVDERGVQLGDVTGTRASTERARELLGWTPTWSVEDGVRATVEWWDAR